MKTQRKYRIKARYGLNVKNLYKKYEIYPDDIIQINNSEYIINTSEEKILNIQSKEGFIVLNNDTAITTEEFLGLIPIGSYNFLTHNTNDWDIDNYGPITVPAAGENINLTSKNLSVYTDIILKDMKVKKWETTQHLKI